MLPCDHVHYDRSTGRSTLLGVFDELRAPRFPASTGPYAVYLNLTNMRGTYDLDARWLRGDTETEIAALVSAPRIVIADPLSRVEVALIGDDLPLPEAGRYVLRLRMNGRHVQDYVIIASEAR
jgi:hypothetical protein